MSYYFYVAPFLIVDSGVLPDCGKSFPKRNCLPYSLLYQTEPSRTFKNIIKDMAEVGGEDKREDRNEGIRGDEETQRRDADDDQETEHNNGRDQRGEGKLDGVPIAKRRETTPRKAHAKIHGLRQLQGNSNDLSVETDWTKVRGDIEIQRGDADDDPKTEHDNIRTPTWTIRDRNISRDAARDREWTPQNERGSIRHQMNRVSPLPRKSSWLANWLGVQARMVPQVETGGGTTVLPRIWGARRLGKDGRGCAERNPDPTKRFGVGGSGNHDDEWEHEGDEQQVAETEDLVIRQFEERCGRLRGIDAKQHGDGELPKIQDQRERGTRLGNQALKYGTTTSIAAATRNDFTVSNILVTGFLTQNTRGQERYRKRGTTNAGNRYNKKVE
ncbi:hypothetical protein C8R42DRAFT_637067 [Lentinula raphanica]|nr:hypothetical protein C8R42DRAFT_637067 [Lentinula raphanica]